MNKLSFNQIIKVSNKSVKNFLIFTIFLISIMSSSATSIDFQSMEASLQKSDELQNNYEGALNSNIPTKMEEGEKELNLYLEDEKIINSVDKSNSSVQLHENSSMASIQQSIKTSDPSLSENSMNWYDYARNKVNKLTVTGTLQVHAQLAGFNLANTYVAVLNSTGSIISSGLTDSNGNITFTLEEDTYSVIVNQTTNFTRSVVVSASTPKTIVATFGYLAITTQDHTFTPVQALIELRNASTGNLLRNNLNTPANGFLNLSVATGIYNIYGYYNYGQNKNGVAVTEGITNVTFTFGDIVGKFGGLKVKSTGFLAMPLTTSVNIKYYSTGTNIGTKTTLNTNGEAVWTGLAPDVYTITFTESNTKIVYENVQITEDIQTNLSAQFGLLVVYQDNTTNDFVEVYEQGNPTRLVYGWISSTTKLIKFILAPGDYNIAYSSQSHPVIITKGQKVEINDQINTNPQRISVTANPARINANEFTNITVKISDINSDYDSMIFSFTPNVGSVSSQWSRFTKEEEFSVDVIYSAPTTLQTMYVDINVSDSHQGFFTYRIYVSDQVGTIHINSTIFGGGLQGTLFEIFNVYSGTRQTYNWANSTGWYTFTNIPEDEYYLKGHEDNIQITSNFVLSGNDVYYYNFKWATLKINSSALNRELIDTSITVYNQTVGISTSKGKTTTLTGDGTATWYLAEGVYYAKASERNNIFKYDLVLIANQETCNEFKFGVMAVYYLDNNGNPASKLVELYNGTDSGAGRLFYSWTSATTGFFVFILAPHSNYTVRVENNATLQYYYYYNISVLPNQGVYVGQFENHAPTIETYTASPTNVLPNQTTTISIVATDPDILDILTYVYIPSMGSINGDGAVVNYTAPSYFEFYHLNISVIDSGGLFDNITRMLSTRTVNINVHVQDSLGIARPGLLVEIFDWALGTRTSYSWTDSAGNVTFNVLEGFYYIHTTSMNVIVLDTFTADSSTPTYNFTVIFGVLNVNSKKSGNNLEITSIKVYDNSTGSLDESGNTLDTGDGYKRFELRPGIYDITATEANILYKYDITIPSSGTMNITFNWAEVNVTTLGHFSMPLTSLAELYNRTSNTRVTYGWGHTTSGHVQFIVAPSSEYQIRVIEDNTFIQNISTTANQQTDVVAEFGLIVVSDLDPLGNPESGVTYSVLNQTTLVTIKSRATNSNGQVFFTLIPGIYQVGVIYFNVVVNSLQRTDLGNFTNNNPVILSIIASPSRIGPNSSTTIRIEMRDDNYDYNTIQANFVLSTGSLGVLNQGWIQTDKYFFEITYYSPSLYDLYQINISLTDGVGGIVDYMLVVSNGLTALNVHSFSNLYQGIVTSINVYRYSNGDSFTQNTNANGLTTFNLYDDYYFIKATEGNIQFIYDVWVKGGEVVNKTFYWGDLVVFSTGVGGTPLSGTLVEIYEQSDLTTRVTYGWTNVDGFVKFTLYESVYRVILKDTTDIVFDNIEVFSGEELNLGSDVPKISRPIDFSFESGTTGNNVSWLLNDNEPGFYNVTIDGQYVVNVTAWTNGTVVTINVDFLTPGIHFAIITANDTNGLSQSDLVIITVLLSINTKPQFIVNATDLSFELGTTGYTISWTLSDDNPDSYQLFRNNSLIDSGPWESNVPLVFNVDVYPIGSHVFRLSVNDTYGEVLSASATVSLYGIGPRFGSNSSDFSYLVNSTDHTISWTAEDGSPDKFVLRRNGAIMETGTWISNIPMTFSIDGLSIGSHIYELLVNDTYGLSNTSTIIVTVTPLPVFPPTVVMLATDTAEEGNTSHYSQWTLYDEASALINYTVYLNGNFQSEGQLANGSTHTWFLAGYLAPGLWNLTVVATDGDGLTASGAQ
ncbi:MAG: hypothetical protein ACW98A_05405 [Candidatus Hodarchaeales archaeon]|jgi:hypothetical protein